MADLIPVKHHVYTSFQGYGSLKSSDDLEPEVLEALDERVGTLAAASSATPRRSTFPVGRYVAVTSAFMMGVDHAGRPRAIAHTILVDREVARALPWFLPLAVDPSAFVGPGNADAAIGQALARALPLAALCPPIDPAEVEAAARSPAASALLAAVLSYRARTAVIGEPIQSLRLLANLSALVPSARRCDAAILTGAGVGGHVHASENGPTVIVLRQAG
ncbi:MAG TPA: hypothetical protein VHF22_11655, partial [Planctomycetota bacterium]|nr:hypothetical protein [Planctomycetota bacterium]